MQITDNPLTSHALVIEKAANGVIVRPHAWSWARNESTVTLFDSVLVFNSFDDFAKWLRGFVPGPMLVSAPAGFEPNGEG